MCCRNGDIFFVFVNILQSWVQFCLFYKRELLSFLIKLSELFFLKYLSRILPCIYIGAIQILAHCAFLLLFWRIKLWSSWKHWLWVPQLHKSRLSQPKQVWWGNWSVGVDHHFAIEVNPVAMVTAKLEKMSQHNRKYCVVTQEMVP